MGGGGNTDNNYDSLHPSQRNNSKDFVLKMEQVELSRLQEEGTGKNKSRVT